MTATTGTRQTMLPRPRLLESLARRGAITIVEAPHGFGKSVLVRQFLDCSETALFIDRHGDLHGAPAGASIGAARVVAVDDISNVDQATAVLGLLADGTVDHAIVTARRIPTDVRRVLAAADLVELGPADLVFRRGEIADLADVRLSPSFGADVAEVLGPTTGGWPAAVNGVLSSLSGQADPLRSAAGLARQSPVAAELLNSCTALLEPATEAAFAQLAHLSMFTTAAAEALGGSNVVEAAIDAGLPIVQEHDRWLTMPPIIQNAFRERGEFRSETARLVAPALVASAGVSEGVRVLLMAGATHDAARLVSQLPGSQLDAMDTHDLLSILRTVEPGAAAHPRLHLAFARVYRNLSWLQAEEQSIRDAIDAARVGAPALGGAVAAAELLFVLAMSGRSDGVLEAAKDLRSRVENPSATFRVQLHGVEAIALAQSPDPADVERARGELLEVANEWEYLGEHCAAGSILRLLAATALGHLGDHTAAQDALRRARTLVIDRPSDRTRTGVFMCRASALAGDLATFDVTAAETEALAKATSLGWVESYLQWAHMTVAALRGSAADVQRRFDAALSGLGELRDSPTGIVFRSEAAIAFALVGLHDAAAEQLDRLGNCDDIEHALASVIANARAGRLAEAETWWRRVHDNPLVPPSRRWRADLEIALARAKQGGDVEGAGELRARAVAEAQRMALNGLVEMLESASGVPDVAADAAVRVRVLGGFGVERGGRPVQVPAGHVAEVLRMLSVSRRGIAVETAIDRLWPDANIETGRRRLKNVVNRVRAVLGNDALDRDSHAITLGSTVVTDLDLFEGAAQAALTAVRGGDGDALDKVVSALDLYTGMLLPTDLYAPWVAEARLATTSRAVALLDTLMSDSSHKVSGPWLLDALMRIDPADDTRLLAIARQCRGEGHEPSARRALQRAMHVADDLGIDLDAEIGDLRDLV